MHIYFQYWGKARPAESSASYHLLPYHCLDVAAVASVLCDRSPQLAHIFSNLLGADAQASKEATLFLIALHDLGKFADSFQRLAPAQACVWPDKPKTRYASPLRHDVLGYIIWQLDVVDEALWDAGFDDAETAHLFSLIAAVTGHHGKPPQPRDDSSRDARAFTTEDRTAIALWVRHLAALWPHAVPTLSSLEEDCPQLSLFLAGLTMVCDWAGSHQGYFPYETEAMPLADYWVLALQRANKMVNEVHLIPPPVQQATGLTSLFPGFSPKPMQAVADQWQASHGPHLFFLEDLTGSGKTEAAMVLAHQLMVHGLARGLYIGLPTMATADQMFDRLAESYNRFYEGQACLVLAHGARKLNQKFTHSIGLENLGEEWGEDPAAAMCTPWLADKSKKALLAAVGVGTVDQSMLAALKIKHAPMRLFGLLDKVLVIDELHAYDDYMQTILQRLIALHASKGGSTILLSATLPQHQRTAFIQAFRRVLPNAPTDAPTENAYPLFSHVDGCGLIHEHPVAKSEHRDVAVRVINDHPIALIQEHIRAGRCVCWIRNSVADAIETWEQCRTWIAAEQLTLFHARFMQADRLRIQDHVLHRFNKRSDASLRKGQLVIATQVVEQSLDVDFDLILSDLAPIDLLIQRLGRQMRHARDAQGNPLPSGEQDQRGTRVFHVYAPPFETEPDPKRWLAQHFPSGQYVYLPIAHLLWLTQKLLLERPNFSLPDDARSLIETVYDGSNPIPASLEKIDLEFTGKRYVQKSVGLNNSFRVDSGYSAKDAVFPEEIATRYEINQQKIRLATFDGKELQPLANTGAHPWADSQVSCPQYWFDRPNPNDPALKQAIAAAPKGPNILIMQPTGTRWSTQVLKDGQPLTLIYDPQKGLMRSNLTRSL